jgi:hypothetical protein
VSESQPRVAHVTSTADQAHAGQRAAMRVDDSKLVTSYSNLCRVTGTPEELAIDFGLNMQPSGSAETPILFHNRIVMSLYTAKRLLGALQMTLQRHEQLFGNLEVDPQKRLVNPPQRPNG